MHLLQSAPVTPGLRDFVRAYAQRDVECSGPELVQPVPASLEHVIEFEFADQLEIELLDGARKSSHQIEVVGPTTRPGVSIVLNGRIQSFGIFFQPMGLQQLFRFPPTELPNRNYPGEDLIGKGLEELWQRLAECPSFEARVAATERYLLERAARVSGLTAIMKAATHLFHQRGVCRIDELARHCGISVRHFERRFLSEIGMSPKLFARVARLETALDMKVHSQRRSWLEISHDLGYHDQMHMIRDFQALSGDSPQRLLGQLGDMRPPALAALTAQ